MSEQESKRRGRPRKTKEVIAQVELLLPKYDEDMSLVDNLIGKRISFTNERLARTFTIASVTMVGNDVCVFEARGGCKEPLTLTCEQAKQLLRKGRLEYPNIRGDGMDRWRMWEPRSMSDAEVITTEVTLQPQEGITEEDVQATREFLKEKGLLDDRDSLSADPSKVVVETLPFVTSSEGTGEPAQTEEKPREEERSTERKASDIVEDCWHSVSNAFSDMLWELGEHPVRPSLAIEANDATTAMLETLARLAAEYKGMEEGL